MPSARSSEAGALSLRLVPDDPGFCTGCGRPFADCAGDCAGPYEAPRHCPECGRRLAVQVTPTGVTARCRDHGALLPPPPA